MILRLITAALRRADRPRETGWAPDRPPLDEVRMKQCFRELEGSARLVDVIDIAPAEWNALLLIRLLEQMPEGGRAEYFEFQGPSEVVDDWSGLYISLEPDRGHSLRKSGGNHGRSIAASDIAVAAAAAQIMAQKTRREAFLRLVTPRPDLAGPVGALNEAPPMALHAEVAELAAVLREMTDLLRAYGETGWAGSIDYCREIIERSDAYGVERLLTFYGGMGSLNDVVLLQAGAPMQSATDRLHSLSDAAYTIGKRLSRER